MTVQKSQIGVVAANSAAVQAQISAQIATASQGGAFWPNPSGKTVLEFNMGGGSYTSMPTGIILNPTPGWCRNS